MLGRVGRGETIRSGRKTMLYRLIILTGALKGQRHPVGSEPLVLGSGADCALKLVDDVDVAREHARIEVTPTGLVIRDLGTVNRLLVNKREVSESPLRHGDVVVIGRTEFLVQACLEADIRGSLPAPRRKPPKALWIALGLVLLAGWTARSLNRGRSPLRVEPGQSIPENA
ncbi:MAG: FHA domain-containing protein, partial [Kiritimatiellia bacterium]|nr:FHA domain-containing protein [Kiritimatiellia bacterium]